MIAIDATAINVSLPVMQRDLQATSDQMLWVIEGYALFVSALTLLGGSLGDVFGRRATFTWGIVLFALASAGCAFAPNAPVLIAARCLQGVGGALVLPQSLALISANYAGVARGNAIGSWSGWAAITAVLGPLLGGFLTQTASWRWVFIINLPLAAAVLAVALLRVPESRNDEARRRLDWVGAVLATIGLGALVYGLIRLPRSPDAAALGSIVAGMAVLALFAFAQTRVTGPMLPLEMFRSRTFTIVNAYTLLLYAALGGSLYFVPFVMIDAQLYTPIAAGAVMLPFVVMRVLLSRWSGGLIARFGVRTPLVAGAALAGAAFLAFMRPGLGGSYWTTYFPAVVLLGAGGVLFIAPLTTAVFDASEVARSGMASAINNAVARVAGLLALAIFGIALAAAFDRSFERRLSAAPVTLETRRIAAAERGRFVAGSVPAGVPQPDRPAVAEAIREGFIGGFRAVMLLSALASFAASAVAFFALPGKQDSRAASPYPIA
jgi:EmrB/QacA subfamily drug resistance transporter